MILNGFAFRVQNCQIKPIINFSNIKLEQLIGLEKQIYRLGKNIEAFIKNNPFLDVLLWGERGCGKSSLVKAFVNKYKNSKLKIIQIMPDEFQCIYNVYDMIYMYKNYKFILFFDDISFDIQDINYRKFKSNLEGGLEEKPENIMIIATSNKRHLIKDKALKTDSIYSIDELNEQMSLYGRFGLSIGFRAPDKKTYLKIVKFYLKTFGVKKFDEWEKEAEAFAISKGARNGRVAKQFVIQKLLKIE